MSAMTVEQSALQQFYTQNSRDREVVLNQLKEITGVEDVHILGNALELSKNESGKYDIMQAVNFLVDENSSQAQVAVVAKSQSPIQEETSGLQVKPQKDTGVIDLTNDVSDKDDLQKAIALSLQDQGPLAGQVTSEEQDISRVLEQSLAESKAAGTKRKRGDIWFMEPLNPHERKRQQNWPVGLKNVGNTCWFSAVIQSLFHLPVFRKLVLNFMPPKLPEISVSKKRNLLFMQELRSLFALMIGSHRKYVDPSKAVEILKEAFTASGSINNDSQQDISEFTHKLLEWLEDAFKSDCSSPSLPSFNSSPSSQYSNPSPSESGNNKAPDNPMVKLFYGKFRAEGHNEGHDFSNEETFGQYPLQVNGFRDLHESLEAATVRSEIESVSSDISSKSGQEQWFTQVPPVLLFELSRFQFNQQLGRPEKIHNKLDFPQLMYMDRYMECNKHTTRSKRETVRNLKEQLVTLQNKLEKFLNYGSGSKRFPLQDVLQYALEFAETKSKMPSCSISQDVEMSSPRSISSMAIDSPSTSPIKIAPDISVSNNSPSSAPQGAPPSQGMPIADPAPKYITDTELGVLQNCLRRWRTEVESNVKELQDSINSIDDKIKSMYNEEAMQRVPYQLHAVLVHEGQASTGHYWAYVLNHARNIWLKFNDITVSEASWEELQKESIGGYHNASAYCLMYIDAKRRDLIGVDGESWHAAYGLDTLLPDLRQLVSEDNKKLEKELADWDAEQQKKVTDSDCTIVEERKSTSQTVSTQTISKQTLGVEHAQLSQKSTLEAIALVLSLPENKSAENVLVEAAQHEINRLQGLAKQDDLFNDHRLHHIIIYLLSNHAPRDIVIHRIILEQFIHLIDSDPRVMAVRQAARRRLDALDITEDSERLYHRWHEDYSNFRKLATYFTIGVESFHKQRYQESLPYFVRACELNELLHQKSRRLGLEPKLLAYFRRQCLLRLNEMAVIQFESDAITEATEALQLMNDLVVPCMVFLNASDAYEEDIKAGEIIREKWCSILGQEITYQKQDKLQDFLTKLFDPSAEMKMRTAPLLRLKNGCDLYERFAEVIKVIKHSNYIHQLKAYM